ncbi:cytochrome P450 [Amylocarpus encephaloides]|uniref:Cytochrome P450 n=1 Tax=Amylocarpus encephaloides TaxID=45428 RepID=A0A9P7Y8A0_9HELO|nr:cytochrome P450 [Amylocarpus encephaloides]
MGLVTGSLLLLLVPVALTIFKSAYAHLTSPIKSIPGPFFAKFTNVWRLLDALGGRAELSHQYLHAKYGPNVRLGPDLVSVSDPELLRKIYDIRGQFTKTNFYKVGDAKAGNVTIANVFSTRNNEDHSKRRSLLNSLYKIGNLVQMETRVDETINAFFKCIDQQFVEGPNSDIACPLDEWLLYFAWDVVGQLTFSKSMGFLDAGKDHSGFMDTSDRALDYFCVVGQLPALDDWLAKNPIEGIRKKGPPNFDAAAGYCLEKYMARVQGTDGKSVKTRDMLDDFLEVKSKNSDMDDFAVVSALLVNILAGADTTGILLRAIVYYTLKNPAVLKRLQDELDAADLTSPVSYSAACKLPYLDAVIREASRIHPGVGLLLERVVPEGGLQLPGSIFLPPGIKVGMSAWVVHQNKAVFGQDAASFNPQRWLRDTTLETEESFAARLANMKRSDLTFGAGKRSCLGKEFTLLETYKSMASLFLKYDMALTDPEKEWKIQNSWFVRQTGLDITFLQRRNR